jgi:hypothetical protein
MCCSPGGSAFLGEKNAGFPAVGKPAYQLCREFRVPGIGRRIS